MRVLLITDDRVGPAMAGSALRAWEMGRALAVGGHTVCLAAAEGSERPSSDGPELVDRPPWRWADAVVGAVWSLPPRAFIGRRPLVADGATPLLSELEALPDSRELRRRRRTAAARLPLVAARADAVLIAGEAQRRWWFERLRSRRPQPPLIPFPFGVPDQRPPAERDEVDGIPRDWAIVLWWGGVWPWLDLETLLSARALLDDAPLSIVVPTAARPGGSVTRFTRGELRVAMARHGLHPPQVVALDHWIPYADRHRLLNRSSLIAVLHHPGAEAELSFRTRALDGVWAGVPLLLTEGGEVARLTAANGWGGVVPPRDPKTTAAALEVMLSEREQLRCRRNLAATRDDWRWSRLARPLLDALPGLPTARRLHLPAAAARAALALLGRRPEAR